MIKTKRLAVALAGALVLVSGAAIAQTGGPPPGRPGMQREGKLQPDPARHLQMLTKRLGLTADQQEQIKPILDEEAGQVKAINNEKLTRDERRTRMQELRQATFEKIKPLLTPEQLKKHDVMRAKMQERRKDRLGPPVDAPAK